MARPKKNIKTPEEQVQEIIASIVVESEYKTAASLQSGANADFESLIDMVELKRTAKDYEWMSDSFIPELYSILLTDSSQWVNQYFTSRDFVDVKLDGDNPNDKDKAKSAKKCINSTLNDRDLYYYPKYVRLRTINALKGDCWIQAWWEKENRKEKAIAYKLEKSDIDIYGAAMIPGSNQIPMMKRVPYETEISRVVVDRFNFDVLDPRNVFTDNKYCYTAQHKDWVTVRGETSYDKLKANEKKNNYFNLDKVKEAVLNLKQKSSTSKETYAKDANGEINNTPVANFDILDRYGKFWAVVTAEDKYGNPIEAEPGLDETGMPKDDAELIEMIITYVLPGSSKIMIRFEPTPFIDATGHTYKPLIRGLCYVHPTKDEGLSDGKAMRELQIAVNDTYNMSADRVRLATLPVFKGNKASLDDNSTIYIEPEHVIELNSPDDLQELQIRDNVQGALEQLAMLTGKMQRATSIFPGTMGEMSGNSGTTATEVAGADMRANTRANYKSLTWEYMFAVEFYWMILQMTHRFAEDETLLKMLGEDAVNWDANSDYTYTPVSSSIETEHNKYQKIKNYDQTLGRVSGLAPQLPELVPVMAHIIGKQLMLMGDEYQDIGQMIGRLANAQIRPKEGGAALPQMGNMGDQMTSNQNGMPVQPMEMAAREGTMSTGGMLR